MSDDTITSLAKDNAVMKTKLDDLDRKVDTGFNYIKEDLNEIKTNLKESLSRKAGKWVEWAMMIIVGGIITGFITGVFYLFHLNIPH